MGVRIVAPTPGLLSGALTSPFLASQARRLRLTRHGVFSRRRPAGPEEDARIASPSALIQSSSSQILKAPFCVTVPSKQPQIKQQ